MLGHSNLSFCHLTHVKGHSKLSFYHLAHVRGLIMGIWNSHTSIGNVLGNTIAGAFVEVSDDIFGGKSPKFNLSKMLLNCQPDQLGVVVHGARNRDRSCWPRHVLLACSVSSSCWVSTRTGLKQTKYC